MPMDTSFAPLKSIEEVMPIQSSTTPRTTPRITPHSIFHFSKLTRVACGLTFVIPSLRGYKMFSTLGALTHTMIAWDNCMPKQVFPHVC